MTWEDAPSHICRGGDKRGLAFCCPPVKPCPILNALDEVNLTPQEYIDIKTEFAKETKLGERVVGKYSNIDGENVVVIQSEDEKILHSIIKLY